ncbi:MAG: hypothetical protein QM743_14395 [Chitinophagaceae bacterium]
MVVLLETPMLLDGYGIAYFTVREDVEISSEAKITLELRPPRQKSLNSYSRLYTVAPPEDANSDKPGNKNTPNINIQAINEVDPYYKDNHWTPETVASVESSKESVIIFINDSNKHLIRLIERAKQYSDQAVDSIKTRYREHIAFTAFMINQNTADKFVSNEEGEHKEVSPELVEKIQKADLANACEAICGIINDFFQVIITESKEEE